MPLVYALTLFLSAGLLFIVEPMIAKMILPLLGGTPSVWNTCMVFFQAALLLGYLYAHLSTRLLGVRRQAVLHLPLMLLPLLVLPLGLPRGFVPPASGNPSLWLLGLLVYSVGLPFLLVSSSAPLLQRWFAGTGHPAARDPYFLYGASNLGSMIALLSYPLLIEPRLSLQQQGRSWAFGYVALIFLTACCALLLLRAPAAAEDRVTAAAADDPADTGPSVTRRLRWAALALCPSSLMLGVTQYLSTDIAAIPLMWVVPLSLYLLSFILVFGRMPERLHRAIVQLYPPLAMVLIFVMFFARFTTRIWTLIPLHLLTFFVAAMACHGELARDRPAPRHLTEFYIWMSVGGVLGGLLNALVAPLLFNLVVEYPLALIASCLLMPRPSRQQRLSPLRDFVLPLLLGLLAAALLMLSAAKVRISSSVITCLLYGLPLVLCYLFWERVARFGLGLLAILVANLLFADLQDHVLYRERSFFGVLRVLRDAEFNTMKLVHGTTAHGQQSLDPARRLEPLTYYHRTGPIGQVFAALSGPGHTDRFRQMAMVGLGAGTLAAYGQPGQQITYYEIDPSVVRIARDPHFFTFLRDSQAQVSVVLGDARLRIAQEPDHRFGLIVIDAFSSDVVPVHLITREALQVYLSKLAPGGVLVFHISNRYFHLAPVLGTLAQDAGLFGMDQNDNKPDAKRRDKYSSHWVVLSRSEQDLGPLAQDPRWHRLPVRGRLWTDDFSDLLGAL